MLNNITWTEYIIAVAILTTFYYLYIGLRYFRGDIQNLLAGKQKSQPAFIPVQQDAFPKEAFPEQSEDLRETGEDQFELVGQLIEELKSIIADASRENLEPNEFKPTISQVLKEYPGIEKSPLRGSVNELIVTEWEKNSAVVLTLEEVDVLWRDDA